MTCTAAESDSSRRVRSSLSVARSDSLMRRPIQLAMAVAPTPSLTAASCSSWATCRRSVMNRSPFSRARTRAGTPRSLHTVSYNVATPLSRSTAAHRWRSQCRSSHSSSVALATWTADQPTKCVSAASDARSRDVGRSSASKRRSHSRAGSARNTEPAPPMTAGTPTSCSALRTMNASLLDRTSTAMWPAPNSSVPASLPSRWRLMIVGLARNKLHRLRGQVRRNHVSRVPGHQEPLRTGVDEAVAPVHDPHAERVTYGCPDEPRGHVRRGRLDVAVRDVRMAQARVREQRVIGPEELLVAAPVLVERPPLFDDATGVEVRVHVRASERIDRLFGVADQHERRTPASEGVAHDLPLHGVRVLELVHQDDVVPVPQDETRLRAALGILECVA